MSLERYNTTFLEQTYTRWVGESVSSTDELKKLAELAYGGNYFYGSVLDTGSELHVLFGQGPTHDIFKNVIQDFFGKEGSVLACQIGVNRESFTINGISFREDPGINDDEALDQNRMDRILAVVRAISKNLLDPEVPISLVPGQKAEFFYISQKDSLELPY